MGRGNLRIYLGAAPGVGKTVAMLDEGNRRARRGTDVVVAFVETHGREQTAAAIADLPVSDLPAVLARRPELALVDELETHWHDVERLLEAGIDVLSTVDVAHLESLKDVVETITGVAPRASVPDAIVRGAQQVQLVDMTPEALQRRMAHGNIYPPEQIDAALGSFFRAGNLTALRELALLWLANQVEEGMQRYREQYGITGTWETRERVVVALTGGPEGEALIRRAARIAARTSGGELMAVHVSRSAGGTGHGPMQLEAQRLLVESLGGTYHSVVGDDIARALLDFAKSVDATQIVLGASRRRAWAMVIMGPGTGQTVTRLAGAIDVHIVSHDYAGRGLALPRLGYGLNRARRLAGLVTAAVLLGAVTPLLTAVRHDFAFASDLSVYLLIVVVTSIVGGFYPAVLAAISGSLLLNYFFAPPVHTFSIGDRDNVLALAIFVLVAVLVSRVVDVSARRSTLAARSAAEAETLSTLAGSLVRGATTPAAVLALAQETFAMEGASLLARGNSEWRVLAAVGTAPSDPSSADASADISDNQTLALTGHAISADDQRVLSAFAAQVAVAYRQWELAEAASAVEPLAAAERARTALLNAVSHDLRTPIASAKAAVSSLLAGDVTWSLSDRDELLRSADVSLDRLTDLVTNLLDLSRLQAGVLPVLEAPVGLDEVVPLALDHAAPIDAPIDVDLPADLPDVRADAGLLERVVANVVQNALRYSPAHARVRITGSEHAGRVELRVIDRGPGIPAAEADAVFAAFQRRNDVPSDGAGVGLGLAIARGFAEAMGGGVTAEDTPGGGATIVIRLVAAQ